MTDNIKDHDTQLSSCLNGWNITALPNQRLLIGILKGEGIGPEIIDASLTILETIEATTDYRFELRYGGKIGTEAQQESGQALTDEVIRFCEDIFKQRGAILCGPGGGRFVYDLRSHFDIYCKMVPLQPLAAMRNAGALKPEAVDDVDILVIRENTGGLYIGDSGFEQHDGIRRCFHHFHYDESQITRILQVAIAAARLRRQQLCVVTKPGGAPAISQLWQELASSLGKDSGVEIRHLEVDTASYCLLAHARDFDVVVAPNMFGDVLADGATLLLGSRGMSYSANFADDGKAVYQTGHGAAYDLTGSDRANPLGQIQSLAMLLKESFGLHDLAAEIQAAINTTLDAGWRTTDIMAPGCREVGTQALAKHVADTLAAQLLSTEQDTKDISPRTARIHD